jgi:NADPH:quinone reductase-like Zn-dependent oxidoreductase
MRAVRFSQCGDPRDVLRVEERPDPIPGPAEVRVRMLAAPINPSDLLFIRGTYGRCPPLPATPGFEGVGMVEASGGGWLGHLLTGRRVCVPLRDGGTWSEQTVVPARRVIPLPADLPLAQAATFFVNPATAWVLTRHVLRVPRGAWLLQTAAGSALGRMMVRLGRHLGIHVISVVRRPEQVEWLMSLGAEQVILFDADRDAPERLVEAVHRTAGGPVSYAMDPVGGSLAAAVLGSLAPGGRLVLFGTLSGRPVELDPRDLMTGQRSVEGFWLGPWLEAQNLPGRLRLVRSLTRLVRRGVLATDPGPMFPLSEIMAAVCRAEEPGSADKVLLSLS